MDLRACTIKDLLMRSVMHELSLTLHSYMGSFNIILHVFRYCVDETYDTLAFFKAEAFYLLSCASTSFV